MTPLFPDLPPANPEAVPAGLPAGKPRLQIANRQQLFWRPTNLEDLLPPDHLARAIWAVVEGLDLSAFTADIRAVEEHEGRPAIDPHLLLAVWLYAFSEGVGSARAVDRLCDQHDAYRWILGGVSVNYHTLSDFRWKHPQALEQLLTDILAGLIHAGLVDFEQVAQDGMRVRASAGADSFRRQPTLEQSLTQAEAQVGRLSRQLEAPDRPPAGPSARQQAAATRAARERQQRLKQALEELPKVRAARAKDPEEARVSMTDPEARVMKMADGGYRPAYNLQFATDCAHQIILGVEVTNIGNDMGRLLPMLDQLERRFGRLPKEVLVDGGYAAGQAIVDASERGVTVYAPVKKGKQPHEPHPGDPPAVADWRVRMGTDHARAIYPLRAATAECVNALARLRSVTQFRLRGLDKVRPLAFLLAIAHNLFRWRTLMPVAA